MLAAPACQLAPPRATRSAPVAWALRARRLRHKPDLRLALRAQLSARHTALVRAEDAARACAGRRSRWLPSPPRATRSAPMAWTRCAPGRLRQPGRGLALRARRRWRVGAARPGTCMCPPRSRARCLLVVRMSRTSWASRCSRALCKARFALLPRARVGRGVSDFIMHERARERLHATAACAVRVGAPRHCNRSALPPGQADPPHFERVQREVLPHDRRHDDRHDDHDEFVTT